MDEERSIAARIENCKRLSKAGQQQAALDEIDLILKSHPQNGFAHFTRGTILHRLGRPYGAIVELLAALDLDGDQASILYNQGVAPDVVMACCGDVPTLETLAAVSILRERLPDLKIRVVNIIDLMKLQPQTEHPHGLSDMDFDELFTKDKPVIFAFHGYPWLIHRLTYRRTNHDNIHVRGYKEEGTITTPFDMTVVNDLDRFHLVMDTIDRLPQAGDQGLYLKQQLKEKLIEHKQYIDKYGEDLPEIRHWKWGAINPGKPE